MPTIGAPIKRAMPPRAVIKADTHKSGQQTRAIVAAGYTQAQAVRGDRAKIQNATKVTLLNDKNTYTPAQPRRRRMPATGSAISDAVQMTLRCLRGGVL